MGFDVEGARKAGYSEPEIVDHLAKQSNFDVAGAKKAGYSDAEILQHLSTVAAAPEPRGVAGEAAAPEAPAARTPKRGGFSKQVGEALYTPAETPRIPTAEELAGRYKQLGIGTLKGVPAGVVGLPGDIESLVHKNTFLPTSHGVGDYIFGPAATKDEQTGRMIGTMISGLAGPAAATRFITPLREAAQTAGRAKTATALRGAEFALDPLSPIVSGAVTLGAKGYNGLRNFANYTFAPELTGVNRMVDLTGNLEGSLAAMRHAEGVPISGGQMTVAEALAAGNVAEPKIAAAQTALAEGATAPQAQFAQQQRVAAIQGNLGNVENQLRLATREITPEMRGDPAAVQAGLEAQVAAEEARLQAAGGGVAGQIPNPNQQVIGQALTEKAAEGAREASKVVTPELYKPVIEAAGDAQIDLAGALQAAEKVRDSAAGTMNASTVSEGIRALEEFRAPFLPGKTIPSIIPGLPGRTGAPIPQPSTVTAEKFMRIRSALSQDVRDAEAAKNFPSARNTKDVIAELDAAFKKGVSEETFKAYENANKKFITEVIDPYRSGVTSQALSDTAHNVSQILPEKLTKAFFESDTSAHQFVTTFGRDPVAVEKMGQGIGGLFRDEVMGADGLVNVEKASEFLRKNSSQLDILEKGGVRIKDQLTAITEQASTNARQRQAFAESSAVFKNAKGADAVIDTALSSAPQMEFLLKQLNADERAGLVAIVKNRPLDAIKAGDPDAAIKFLTENQGTIRQAIGQTEHTKLLNAAQVQKRLDALQGTVPREGLYDPKVLAKQFSAPQLANLNVAANDIARLQQVEKTAAEGGGARVAAKPSTANFGALLTSVSGLHPLSWAKVLVDKIKNVTEARVAAEAVNTMYYNPQRYAAALEAAIKQKKTIESVRTGAKQVTNALAPGIVRLNALIDQQGRR